MSSGHKRRVRAPVNQMQIQDIHCGNALDALEQISELRVVIRTSISWEESNSR